MRYSSTLSVVLVAVFSAVCADSDNYKIVCYYGSWATYREGNGKFTSENINPTLCTHAVYQYAGIGPDYGIRVMDTWLSLNTGLGDFRKFSDMKRYNQNVKLLIGIGGFNEGPDKFSRMASVPSIRTFFVNTVVQFLDMYNFDGISIDWMYPGGNSGDKNNYVHLLKELRDALTPRNKILAIAASATESVVDKGYDVREISRYVDFVSLLSFDYHGGWQSITGHNSPLYPRRDETGEERKANQEFSVHLWMKKGMDASKLVLGIPTYGRTFALHFPDRNSVGAPSSGYGNAGYYTKQAGSMGYNELVEFYKEDNSLTKVWDSEQKVPYAYKGNFWISYDDKDSVSAKADFIVSNGLGGAMVYSLETDDFNGLSGVFFPLLQAVNDRFKSGTWGTWTTTILPTQPASWEPPTRDPSPVTDEPWKPPTNRPNMDICKRPGSVKDPENCERFYSCRPYGENTFIGVLQYCPPALGFDESTGNCNFKSEIPGCS